MTAEAKQRAIDALKGERLGHGLHLPRIFIVNDKLFVLLHAAKAYRDEVCPNTIIEIITIFEAYGGHIPAKVRVDWNFI